MGSAKSKLALIILYALGLSLLTGLSFWQYQRGLEKQKMAELAEQSGVVVIATVPENWDDNLYKASELDGHWLGSRSLILENRVYKQRVGFEVLTPFRLADDKTTLLVNRGWVATPEEAARQPISGPTRLGGVLYLPEKGVALGASILPGVLNSDQWPKKSLYIDLQVFSDALKMNIEPVMLVLNDDEPSAFIRIWKASVMSAAKHFGYAVQWAGLAITFLIYGVIWFRRQSK